MGVGLTKDVAPGQHLHGYVRDAVIIYCWVWATINGDQVLYLALCSKITSSRVWGTVYVVPEIEPRISVFQCKFPTHYTISLILSWFIYGIDSFEVGT